MPRQAVEIDERACVNCGRTVPAERGGSDYCKDECELEYLRQEVRDKDQRLQRLSRKKGPPKCLGRVNWATCLQEWYLKDSYDAKRRANQLRKLGYNVTAATVGLMPLDLQPEQRYAKITILTAWKNLEERGDPPPAPEFIDGLRTNGNGR